VYGLNFVNTGNIHCKFSDMEPFKGTFINNTFIQCAIPAHNASIVSFTVGNDKFNFAYQVFLFEYFHYCKGEMDEVCNGINHGICINSTTEPPYCMCNSIGYNKTSDCRECKPLTHGPNCDDNCKPCIHGKCREGFFGDGTCECGDGYEGIDCSDLKIVSSLPVIIPIIVIVLLIIAITIEFYRRYKIVQKNKKQIKILVEKEKSSDNEEAPFIPNNPINN